MRSRTLLSGWLASITLPVVALLFAGIASTAQQIRGATIDVLERDFVRTLRARGLGERAVIVNHVLRAAAVPALTVLSLQFIGTIGGAVVIEKIRPPGLGLLGANATIRGDMPVIMGVLIVTAVIVIVVNISTSSTAGSTRRRGSHEHGDAGCGTRPDGSIARQPGHRVADPPQSRGCHSPRHPGSHRAGGYVRNVEIAPTRWMGQASTWSMPTPVGTGTYLLGGDNAGRDVLRR